jgi:hypothetical protein
MVWRRASYFVEKDHRLERVDLARRSAPGKTDAYIENMIAVTGVIINGIDLVKKEFIAVTEIQKRAVVHEELDARLRTYRTRGIAVVPHQPHESAEIGNNNVG